VPVARTQTRDSVGDYHLFVEIAAGGMATVHLGHKQGDPQCVPVAIKRLHPQFTHDPEFLTMFADEVRVVTHIQHPNVVATLDIVQDRRDLSLVMQYVHGESFSRLLGAAYRNGHPASPAIVRTVMVDVLRGLHSAHEARDVHGMPLEIVHRDVSPQNIIVSGEGIARILDFGIAKAIGRATVTRDNEVRGKVAYMAPEQLQRGQVDRRTDIYAAAIILWEALTCKRLFHSDSDARTLARVLTLEVTPPSHHRSGLTAELDYAVLRGLSRDPAQRFATALELANAIAASGPCASRQELGHWVQSIAAEKLAERARWISTMQTDAIRKANPMFFSPSSLPPSHTESSGVRSAPEPFAATLAAASKPRDWLRKACLATATITLSVSLGAWIASQFPDAAAPAAASPPSASTVFSLSTQAAPASNSAASSTAAAAATNR
jgi:eukaryotic-like serine/threonine-protein kinase